MVLAVFLVCHSDLDGPLTIIFPLLDHNLVLNSISEDVKAGELTLNHCAIDENTDTLFRIEGESSLILRRGDISPAITADILWSSISIKGNLTRCLVAI